MLLPILAALVVLGVLGMIVSTISGGGSNVILIPILILLFSFSPGEAIGTAFLAVVVGSVVAVGRFSRRGYVDFRRGVVLGMFTVPGIVTGSVLSFLAEGGIFRVLLGVVVMALAVVMVMRDPNTRREGADEAETYHVNLKLGAILFGLVGFFIGFFGQGGGLIVVPVLILIGFSTIVSLGTVRLITIIVGGTAFLSRLALSQVNITYGLALAIGAMIGALIGVRVATAMRAKVLRLVAAMFIAALGLMLIVI